MSCKLFIAQNVYFDLLLTDYDTLNSTQEWINDIEYATSQNSYYAAGHLAPTGTFFSPSLYKINENGTVEKATKFSQDSTAIMTNKICLLDTSLVIIGTIRENDYSSGTDYFILETNYETELSDFDLYGTPSNANYNNKDFIRDVAKSYNNGIITCGYSYNTMNLTDSSKIWINKIDLETDSIVWEVIINNSNLIDISYSIERSELDSSYIILTDQEEQISNYDVQHCVLVKIDDNGNILNTSANFKTDNSIWAVNPRDLSIDNDGNSVVIANESDFSYIAKFDQNLNMLWEKNFIHANNESINFSNVVNTMDGNIAVSGYVTLLDNYGYNFTQSGFVAKFKTNSGDTLWYKNVFRDSQGLYAAGNTVNAFALAPDSGFVIGGAFFYAPNSQYSNTSDWIKKIDKYACSSSEDCSTPIYTANNNANQLHKIKIKGNPFKDELIFQINGTDLKNKYFKIIDLNGKIILKDKAAQSNQVNIPYLKPGIYFLNLYHNNKLQVVKKVIKY